MTVSSEHSAIDSGIDPENYNLMVCKYHHDTNERSYFVVVSHNDLDRWQSGNDVEQISSERVVSQVQVLERSKVGQRGDASSKFHIRFNIQQVKPYLNSGKEIEVSQSGEHNTSKCQVLLEEFERRRQHARELIKTEVQRGEVDKVSSVGLWDGACERVLVKIEHLEVRSVVAKVWEAAIEIVFEELKTLEHDKVGQRRRNCSREFVVGQNPGSLSQKVKAVVERYVQLKDVPANSIASDASPTFRDGS